MLEKMLAAQKRKNEKLSSGKVEFEKLVANAETSTVLHLQPTRRRRVPRRRRSTARTMANWVCTRTHAMTCNNRVSLIPVCGKPACQAFLVSGVLSIEDGICGTNEWCKRAAHVLAGASVHPLLCFCCLPAMASHDDRW